MQLLPRIERYAQRALRGLQGEAKDDAICEVIALCLCAYQRLDERNQLQRAFASVLTRYAIAAYFTGRRVGVVQCSRDVYSLRARREAGVEIRSIGTPKEQRQEWMECLTDNHRTPVPEQAHFRMEFPRWLWRQTRRNRQIVERLSLGYSTSEVAQHFSVSPGRISQLRRELHDSWQALSADRQPEAIVLP